MASYGMGARGASHGAALGFSPRTLHGGEMNTFLESSLSRCVSNEGHSLGRGLGTRRARHTYVSLSASGGRRRLSLFMTRAVTNLFSFRIYP